MIFVAGAEITIAMGIVLCHRFYLHQSHARNEWQVYT
jgi:hypothetical protein